MSQANQTTPHHDTNRFGQADRPTGARPRTRTPSSAGRIAELESELLAAVRRRHADTYELLVLIAEFDRLGFWAVRGALSCATWLADRCDIDISTARTHVRVARALLEFPALDAAMASGDLSYSKARTLAAHLTATNVDALLGIAATTPAGRLGAAIAAWSLRNEDQNVIDERQHAERSLSWRVDPDGMVTFTVKLPPAEAARLQAHIATEVMRGTHADPGSGPEPDGSADASRRDPDPLPPLAQQRADALCRITDRQAGSKPGTTTGPATEIVVHVREDGNTFADGTPLADNAVTSMLPESFISLLIHDNDRYPIDASPRRQFPTRRQRRVVDERSAECAHPGCHARVLLQYDHIEPRHLGGATVVDNLQRLCGPHNRAKGTRRPTAPPDELDGAA